MARYKVEICGINTSSLKALSNEENKELFTKAKTRIYIKWEKKYKY